MSEFNLEEILSSVASNPELLNKISSTVKGEGKDMSQTIGEVVSLLSASGLGGTGGAGSSGGTESTEDLGSYANRTDSGLSDKSTSGSEKASSNSTEDAQETLKGEGLGGFNLDGLLGGKGQGGLEGLLFSLGKGLTSSSALLLAIKPFLSRGRQDLIDTLIKLSKLSALVNLAR